MGHWVFFRVRFTSFHTQPVFLPSSSVSLSYFILAVAMPVWHTKHLCMSSAFPIAILNGSFYLRETRRSKWSKICSSKIGLLLNNELTLHFNIHLHAFLICLFDLFHSCCYHAQVLWPTLLFASSAFFIAIVNGTCFFHLLGLILLRLKNLSKLNKELLIFC